MLSFAIVNVLLNLPHSYGLVATNMGNGIREYLQIGTNNFGGLPLQVAIGGFIISPSSQNKCTPCLELFKVQYHTFSHY